MRESIEELVLRSRASGMIIEFATAGVAGAMSPMVGRAAYRVVQEALTNAAKHAAGATVTVRVDGDDTETVITVANGRPAAPGRGSPVVGTA
ncbi:MAG TPA: hypothetical protein VF755_27465 [Catenuloplanes sp.]